MLSSLKQQFLQVDLSCGSPAGPFHLFLSSYNRPLRRHLNKSINFMIQIWGNAEQKREWFVDLE